MHTDHLGTPGEMTDEQGELRWAATYRAWGNVLRVELPEIIAQQDQQAQLQAFEEVQPLRFQGQYYDAETGLHYNQFRYYDPDCGRFVGQDPIGLQGGINLYRYSPNPIGWIDPLGLTGCKCDNLDRAITRSVGTETSSAVQGAQLHKHLSQLQKYGDAGYKELQNGRIRYYGEITPALKPGEMVGARLVREWTPLTNMTRTWYETLDGTGNIRSVAPKPVSETLNHRIFDSSGKYVGRR